MPITQHSGTLGVRNAAHLLRRATFGPDKASIDSFASLTAEQGFALLTATVATPTPPSDLKTGLSWLPKPNEDENSENGDLTGYVKSWWLDQMLNSGTNIKERMVFLFHTFYPTIDSAVENATALYYQNALFRFYALGNIKTLTKKMCVDNAMLILLDGRINEVGRPNENFARELFELHTIGRGPELGLGDYTNYTEADIKIAARILSGWDNDNDFAEIDIDTGLPTGIIKGDGIYATRHDASNEPERKFSEAFQNTVIKHAAELILNQGTINEQTVANVVDGKARKESVKDQVSQLVEMIFNQDATALNFCRKIYRFFVYYEITADVETNVIVPLAATFKSNNFEILPVIKELLCSQYFYDNNNAITTDNTHGDIIKSPLEVTLGAMRFFNVVTPLASTSLENYYDFYGGLLGSLNNQGIQLYEPYDVAGYDAYHQEPDFNRNWITVNTLAYRYEFTLKLARNTFSEMISVNLPEYVKTNVTDPTNPSNIVQHFVDYMLPEIISTGSESRFEFFLNILKGDKDLPDSNWTNEWNLYLARPDLPDAVNGQLQDFLAAIMQTPEYQLM